MTVVPAHSASTMRVDAPLLEPTIAASRMWRIGAAPVIAGQIDRRRYAPILQLPSFGGAMISMSSFAAGTAPSAS